MYTMDSSDLTKLAKRAMIERQFLIGFSNEAKKEVNQIYTLNTLFSSSLKDLRNSLWFSIDNEETKDIDQLTFAEQLDPDHFKVYVAIADVESLVPKYSAIDLRAQYNTTSVYTPTQVFPMLPEELSNHLTSLNEHEDRQALVVEMEVSQEGVLGPYQIYPALVYNHAKLTYHQVTAWLNGDKALPERFSKIRDLEEQIKLQNKIAHLLRRHRQEVGALILDPLEPYPILRDDQVVDVKVVGKNQARELIESLMIAANTTTALFLSQQNIPSIRRVVETPQRWDRIVDMAQKYGDKLPEMPDSKALNSFLVKQRALNPAQFPHLSLSIVKLLGEGRYVLEYPGKESGGHFSLALKDYTHSTAPNRRYPDLVTQRLLKAALAKRETPYLLPELEYLAEHCTEQENEAAKIERKMKKSAVVLLLSSRINQTFDALVTGASPKGTWVRIFRPPVEGKLIQGFDGLDVGDRIRVQLVNTDVEKGFIDFIRLG